MLIDEVRAVVYIGPNSTVAKNLVNYIKTSIVLKTHFPFYEKDISEQYLIPTSVEYNILRGGFCEVVINGTLHGKNLNLYKPMYLAQLIVQKDEMYHAK